MQHSCLHPPLCVGVCIARLSLRDYEKSTRYAMQQQLKVGLSILKHHTPCFAGWRPMELRNVVRLCTAVDLAPRETLFRADDPTDRLYFLLEGEMDVVKIVKESRRNRWPVGLRLWQQRVVGRDRRVLATRVTTGAILGAEAALCCPREVPVVPPVAQRDPYPDPANIGPQAARRSSTLTGTEDCDISDGEGEAQAVTTAASLPVSEVMVGGNGTPPRRQFDAIAVTHVRLLALHLSHVGLLSTRPRALAMVQRQAEEEGAIDSEPGENRGGSPRGEARSAGTERAGGDGGGEEPALARAVLDKLREADNWRRYREVVLESVGTRYTRRLSQRGQAVLPVLAGMELGGSPQTGTSSPDTAAPAPNRVPKLPLQSQEQHRRMSRLNFGSILFKHAELDAGAAGDSSCSESESKSDLEEDTTSARVLMAGEGAVCLNQPVPGISRNPPTSGGVPWTFPALSAGAGAAFSCSQSAAVSWESGLEDSEVRNPFSAPTPVKQACAQRLARPGHVGNLKFARGRAFLPIDKRKGAAVSPHRGPAVNTGREYVPILPLSCEGYGRSRTPASTTSTAASASPRGEEPDTDSVLEAAEPCTSEQPACTREAGQTPFECVYAVTPVLGGSANATPRPPRSPRPAPSPFIPTSFARHPRQLRGRPGGGNRLPIQPVSASGSSPRQGHTSPTRVPPSPITV